jgi:hypothetical protein
MAHLPYISRPQNPLSRVQSLWKQANCQISGLCFLTYLLYFVAIGCAANCQDGSNSCVLAVFSRQVVDFNHPSIMWTEHLADISNG